jgi:putative ABC transport system permease protein
MKAKKASGGGKTERRVELSQSAESAFRALRREQQHLVARRIDHVAKHGIPADAPVSDAGVRVVPAGSYLLLTLQRGNAVIIVAIEATEEPAPATIRRAAKAQMLGALGSRFGRACADLWMDLRVALRAFRQQPTFVAVTVLTLALGIGGNTAVFGVFSNVFLGELPLRHADRLLRLRSSSVAPNGEVRAYNMAPRDFVQIRARATLLEDVVGIRGHSFTVAGDGAPERIGGLFVSENMTGILGVEPILGVTFTHEQEALGADSGVVLIGHALWQRRFGGDPAAVGAALLIDGRPTVVVGVMPRGFNFPYDAELWMPGQFSADDGRSRDLAVFAHRKPGVDFGAVRQELDAIAAALEEDFPDTNGSIGIQARPAREDFIEDGDNTVLALAGAVGFLLLITCVNVTNVLLARFSARRHEIGIRAALGAGRTRQLRQFLVETGLLFGAGGVAGLLLTLWLRRYLLLLIPNVLRDQLDQGEIQLGAGVLAFTAALTLLTALICGGVAALRAVGGDLQQVLREGSRSSGSAARRLLQRGLVVAEVSLALVLLVGAGLMIDHFRGLQGEQLGFDVEQLLTLRINLEGTAYDNAERRTNLLRSIEEAIGAVPGVVSVGMTTVNPICCGDWAAAVEIEGREPVSDGSRLLVSHRYVSPDFFAAMRIPIARGRAFSQQDDAGALPVVMIDRRMADHFWPGDDPLGTRIRIGNRPDAPWLTIVGVAETIKDESDYEDGWYLPFRQSAAARGTDGLHFMVRYEGAVESIVAPVERAVWEAAPDLAVYDARAMADVADDLVADDRLAATVAGAFALLGTALAGFGVYGLMAFWVSQQRLEIGTRLALGARPADVLGMVVRQALWMTAVGLGIGIVASVALSRIMTYFMSGLDATSIPMVAGVALMLGIAALLATWIPARRAARIDPMRVLRSGG